MALETTFRQLSLSLHKLHDALNALHVTLGDQPQDDQSAMADALENAVLDMLGTLHEARTSALRARRAIGHPPDHDRARRALALCQERFHDLEQQFASDLVSYEKLRQLARFTSERRPWIPWASAVRQGIEQCREPIDQASKDLACCWQELAERAGMVNISVQATGIKQEIEAQIQEVSDDDEIRAGVP